MAYYLVTAKLIEDKFKEEIIEKIDSGSWLGIRPFGREVTKALGNSRVDENGSILWEEEDYCTPPLKEEKAAILDKYFKIDTINRVERGEGWTKIDDLPYFFNVQNRIDRNE